MDTRNQAVKVTKILHIGHEFKSFQQFPTGFLPTTKQVICRVLNEVNFLKSEAANTVAQELVQLWTGCNVYTISISSVVRKIQELIKEFSNLDRYPKAKPGTTFLKREAIFVENWITYLISFVKIKDKDAFWKQLTAFACAAKIMNFITTRIQEFQNALQCGKINTQ